MTYSEQLSLEQQFNLRRFADWVQTLYREEAQSLSIELYRRIVIEDKTYEDFLEYCWGTSL